jgi:hypothetical protein
VDLVSIHVIFEHQVKHPWMKKIELESILHGAVIIDIERQYEVVVN